MGIVYCLSSPGADPSTVPALMLTRDPPWNLKHSPPRGEALSKMFASKAGAVRRSHDEVSLMEPYELLGFEKLV